jgi:tetratricopeptide (TPR) repeat protein
LDDYYYALNAFRNALKFNSSENQKSRIFSFISKNYLLLGDYKNALKASKTAIALNPKSDLPYIYLGYLFYLKNFIEKAEKMLEKSLNINIDNYEAWYILGLIRYKQNNYLDAFEACRKSLSINNQYYKAISFYKQLLSDRNLRILAQVLPIVIDNGYRYGYTNVDNRFLSKEEMKEERYIYYSKDFKKVLNGLSSLTEDVIAIYGCFPTCSKCGGVHYLYGEQIDYKSKTKTYYYRCALCDEEENTQKRFSKNVPILDIFVILENQDFLSSFMLEHENICIQCGPNLDDFLKSYRNKLLDIHLIYKKKSERYRL